MNFLTSPQTRSPSLLQSNLVEALYRSQSRSKSFIALAFVCVAMGCWGNSAVAQTAAEGKPVMNDVNDADRPQLDLVSKTQPADLEDGLWTSPNLLGDMGGLRTELGRHGMTLGLTETSEWLQNVQGGIQRGRAYHGLTTLTLGLDTQVAGARQGGSFNLSALQIHGNQLSADHVGSLQTASGIEADPGPRLWEAWYQQKLLNGKLDLRIGQQSIDQEFMVSQYAGTFIGTVFGWPAVPSYDLPAGGPAYPLSALGVRLRASLGDSTSMLVGAYAGNPANSSGSDDPQKTNSRGTTFSLSGGTLYIAEFQYGHNQPTLGELNTGVNRGLPGTYKFGAWYHNQMFADPRLDASGLSLADPGSNGKALQHSGNYSVYGVADQMVWRESEDGVRAINLFARAIAAPGDRNLISFSANLGVTMNAPFTGRRSDVVGLGVGYVKVGSHIVELDRNANFFKGTSFPVRNRETFIEATYQYQVTPWWQIQGDLQYTMNPGGGAVDPNDPSQTNKLPNAWVLGLRTNITF